MSRHTLAALAAAASIAGLAAGCHTCEDHEGSKTSYELAQFNYDNGSFDQAKILFTRCVEQCPAHEEGWIGLANACRETGNNQFKSAADLAGQGKVQDSKRLFKEAVANHALAYQIFQQRLKDNPEDIAPHYGLGMLYYQRSTSILPFPFPIDDVSSRQKERDLAISEFELILAKAPRAWQIHRYLGLALFAAGRLDEGHPHLNRFHDAQQALYERILQWPGYTEDEKKRKETALQSVNRDIEDIRDVLGEYFMTVQHDIDRIKARRERTPADEVKLARLNTESLLLEKSIKGFHLTNLNSAELELRAVCDAYLSVFNTGKVSDIMSFVATRQGEEAAVQRAVQDRVEQGTKYSKMQYRTIVVSGQTASVAIVCDVTSKSGLRPDAELTMHWRLVAGKWKVAELP